MKKLLLLLAAISLIFTACSNLLGNEDESATENLQIELSQNNVGINYEAGTHSVTVTSPYSWRASSYDNWIKVDTATGIAGTKELEFSVTCNEDLKVREGTIVIKNEDYNLVKELYVVQDAFSPHISINTTHINFTADGDSQEVVVTANCEYEVSTSAEWLSYTREDNILIISALPSGETEIRSAEITVFNTKYEISKVINVSQDACPYQITLNTTSLHFSADGDSQEVVVTANCEYEVSTSAEWLSYTREDNILIISALPSGETEIRSAEITVFNTKYEISKVINVSQDACPYQITLNTTSLHFSADGGSQEVVVTADCEYEVSTSANWLSIERVDNRIKVTAEKSYVTEVRSAEIVISNKMYNISEIVKVEQETRWSKEGSIVGSWKLSTWGDESESSIMVYIAFHNNNHFDLYQRFSSILWTHYSGTYTLNGGSLIGVYSDGVAWADEYEVLFSEGAICLIRKSDNNDISIYTKAEIPNHIVEESQNPQESRSVSEHRFL